MTHAPSSEQPNFDALRRSLARLRHDRGWSYDELAARSGVGRASLVAIESGKRRRDRIDLAPSRGNLLTWFRLAAAFEMPLGEILSPLYEENEES
ncbi:XRE family transcriptional regulator [Subtercola sp. Z020]|nr:XRE family transcriptional regulator [Subtercola sp. Z020]